MEQDLLQATKAQVKQAYQIHEKDTGSADVQVALLTRRIERLTEHLRLNRKDHSSRYGLVKLVSARRTLLNHLRREDEARYQALIKRLSLRK